MFVSQGYMKLSVPQTLGSCVTWEGDKHNSRVKHHKMIAAQNESLRAKSHFLSSHIDLSKDGCHASIIAGGIRPIYPRYECILHCLELELLLPTHMPAEFSCQSQVSASFHKVTRNC